MSAGMDWNGPHWKFSLSVYRQPKVEKSCLLLQDQCGVDINLLLVTLYFVSQGALRCDEGTVAAADEKIRALRESVIVPLRELRRKMKSNPVQPFQRES